MDPLRVRPFEIGVPDAALDDLRERLARTRWPEEWPGVGWDAGADQSYVRELCEYWAGSYDWRQHERNLNRIPGFRCLVDGVDLHFWHVRSSSSGALPLLLVHGWPGSIFEFRELIAPLTDPVAHGGLASDAFDVVVPALPGFGFGGKPAHAGWGPTRIARAFHRLMTDALGYDRYGVQGGDWGASVASQLGSAYPRQVAGIHLNFILAATQVSVDQLAGTSDADRAAIERRQAFAATGSAYARAQGTVPRSLALAQADSPAGLAAWIVDKFRAWSDCDGDVEQVFTKDQLLTNLMFYWAPNSVASAARIYLESRADAEFLRPKRVGVPTGVAMFPREILPARRSWAEGLYDIRRWTDMPRGGHFAAMEQPELLLADVRAFFRDLGADG
jgi:epoxide hydrolase